MASRTEPIEHVEGISPEAFFAGYYEPARPVLLRGFLRGWPAFGTWSPPHFATRFGDVDVEVTEGPDASPRGPGRPPPARSRVSFVELARRLERSPDSGDWYVVAQNQALREPRLSPLWGDLDDRWGLLEAVTARERVALWFGPGQTVTPLHYDLQHALLAQAYGSKRVVLISPAESARLYNERGGYSSVDPEAPDLVRYPRFEGVPAARVVVEAGDALFLPARWWHQVRSLTPSTSLSLANFRWPNPGPSAPMAR
jgi:hypothetical protein